MSPVCFLVLFSTFFFCILLRYSSVFCLSVVCVIFPLSVFYSFVLCYCFTFVYVYFSVFQLLFRFCICVFFCFLLAVYKNYLGKTVFFSGMPLLLSVFILYDCLYCVSIGFKYVIFCWRNLTNLLSMLYILLWGW